PFHAARRIERDRVAFTRPEQRASDWRYPAHVSASSVDLVDANDAHRSLFAAHVAHRRCRAEKNLVGVFAVAPRQRVDDFSAVEAPDQKADAAIDLAQAFFS